MNSKYGGHMGYQRLIKTIKSIGGGGGGELTADSVDSSHILNGAILNGDISDNTIEIEKLATGLQSNINDTLKLRGVINIRNVSEGDTKFKYTLYYLTSGVETEFASLNGLYVEGLYVGALMAHYFVLPTPSSRIRLTISNGVSLEGIAIRYGGEIVDGDGLVTDFDITDVNVLIEAGVAI